MPSSATHARTFQSGIDRSVQYYGVVPMAPVGAADEARKKPALVLTLHGASVEAIGQAREAVLIQFFINTCQN